MIPSSGRDVQCSNCGQMWFQAPEGADPNTFAPPLGSDWQAEDEADWEDDAPAAVAQDGQDAPVERTATAETAEDAAAWPEPEPFAMVEAEASEDVYEEELGGRPLDSVRPASAEAATAEAEAPAAASFAPRPRRNLNEAVLSVLREEAERESRARRAATGATFDQQSELPLDTAPPPPRRRFDAPEPETADTAVTAPATAPGPMAAPVTDPDTDEDLYDTGRDTLPPIDQIPSIVTGGPARRDLLPDIEEINSTLRATSERGQEHASVDAPETLRRQRSGFRLGFGLMLAVAVLIIGFYRAAPLLAEQVPALAPALDAVIGTIDAGRLWLHGLLAGLIGQ